MAFSDLRGILYVVIINIIDTYIHTYTNMYNIRRRNRIKLFKLIIIVEKNNNIANKDKKV